MNLLKLLSKHIEQHIALPDDDEVLRTKKAATIPLLLIGALLTIINVTTYFTYGMTAAGRIYLAWTIFAFSAALFIWLFPRHWLPIMYAVVIGVMVTSLSTSTFSGGFQSGLQPIVWMMLGPISAALIGSLRGSIVITVLYLIGILAAVYLEPLAQAVAPDLPLFTRMQIAAGNMIMMGLFAFAAVLYLIREVERYRQRADDLLINILPETIAVRLKENPQTIAESFSEVSVLFADVVGFTTLSEKLSPHETVDFLNEVFIAFDKLAEKYGVEKIRTIGDGYMVAAGVPLPLENHAQALAAMALEMQDYMKRRDMTADVPLQVRIGINSGPVVAGIVGTTKFHYDLWGDMVNTASRMESHGLPGKIQIARPTYEIIKDEFHCQSRGMLEVKGKGQMETWLVTGPKNGF